MSEANTNVAAALSVAQDKKAADTTKKLAGKSTTAKANAGKVQAGSNLPGARRTQAPAVPVRAPITFESARFLCPSEGVIAKIVRACQATCKTPPEATRETQPLCVAGERWNA